MSDIKIGRITLGMCQTNTYFVYRNDTKEGIIFDPADRGDYLYEKFTDNGITVGAIVLTHGHFDHIWGVEKLVELSGATVYAGEDEAELLGSASMNCSKGCGRPCEIVPDKLLGDNEEISLCGITIKAIKTPGHTMGGMCYYIPEAGFLIAGDTLFSGSVGRTDLPTGSMSTLIRSIKEKLMILPDDTKVYPGHGDSTTIFGERNYNPFI